MRSPVELQACVMKTRQALSFRVIGDARGRANAGSTLLELMLVLLIFGTLTAIAAALVLQTYRSVQGQLSSTTLYDTSSTALMQMGREIRMAGYPSAKAFSSSAVTSNPGIVAVPYVSPLTNYKLIIQAAVYGNGLVQQIQYENPVGTTVLQRTVTQINPNGTPASGGATSTVMLTGVQNVTKGIPLFTWDIDPSSPQSFPLNVRTIYINLVVQSSGSNGSVPVPVVLTAACPRQNF